MKHIDVEQAEADECNGICLSASDLGLPEYDRPGEVAHAHPDCPVHGNPIPDSFEPSYETMCADDDRPEDADEALPSYRLAVPGRMGWNYIEMTLDAAEYELVQRICKAFDANTAKAPARPLCFDRRIKPGPLEFDSNFTDA